MQRIMSKGVLALVGVGPGIGGSVATKFLSEGYDVAVIARGQEKVDKWLSENKSESKR